MNMNQHEVLTTLARFFQRKATEYHIRRIGLFGSAARDELTSASDIDVVVELTEPDLFALIGIKQDLEELLECSVDIVRYRQQMNGFLKERIERETIYV